MTEKSIEFTSQQRTIFALSMFSNVASWANIDVPDLEGTAYGMIRDALEKAKPTIGEWKIVWGPSVVQFAVKWYPVNTMYVAQSVDDPRQYVIAIAGTSPSRFDQLVEDVIVFKQVDWKYPDTQVTGAKISVGTAVGFSLLKIMKPTGDRPGANTTLQQFLRTIAAPGVKLTTTGHSLGGTLAPTLALWLYDIRKQWDSSNNVEVSSMPTAGMTAGNDVFASYSDSVIGSNMNRIANSLDVIPHLWNEVTLGQLPTLYIPTVPESAGVSIVVQVLIDITRSGKYTQIQASAPPIRGTINPDRKDFSGQMDYQHFPVYRRWFGYDDSWTPGIEAADGSRAAATPPLPRRIPIGLETYEVPASADDPRMQELVLRVQEAIQADATSGG